MHKSKSFVRKIIIIPIRHYSKPYNRWQYYYGNEDGINRLDMSYIENFQMSSPYEPLYYHENKYLPAHYYPAHLNDHRYNYNIAVAPSTNVHSLRKIKMLDDHEFYSTMHGIEWYDMQLDAQIEEPMSSNHYSLGCGQRKAIYLIIYIIIFCFSKLIYYHILYIQYIIPTVLSIHILWLWCHGSIG